MKILEFTCPRCKKTKQAEVFADNTGLFVPCQCDLRAIELEHRQAIERRKEHQRRSKRRQ